MDYMCIYVYMYIYLHAWCRYSPLAQLFAEQYPGHDLPSVLAKFSLPYSLAEFRNPLEAPVHEVGHTHTHSLTHSLTRSLTHTHDGASLLCCRGASCALLMNY